MATTDHDVDLRTQPLAPEKSLGELVSDMTESLSGIFRKEIELAKVELKDEASRAGKGAGMLGDAGMSLRLRGHRPDPRHDGRGHRS